MSDINEPDNHELTAEELAAIEEKFDEGSATRAVGPTTGQILRAIALVFALYHFITAGFGLPADHWHMGWHLSGLFILTYAFLSDHRDEEASLHERASAFRSWQYSPLRFGFYDSWRRVGPLSGVSHGVVYPLLGIDEQTFRMGNPNSYDLFFGIVVILLVLDIARRTLGWVLPLIICYFH